ncbi:MAG: hypothetical protein HKM92_03905 [Arenibacter sp.]|nr:hypothetical protein [Arenibacter sp.]
MSNAKTLTPKRVLFSLSITHTAVTAGILLFILYIFLSTKDLVLGFPSGNNALVYLVPVIAMIAYFGSNYYFQKKLAQMIKSNSLREKLALYQQTSMVRYAMLDAATFFGAIAFMLNRNIFYLVISLLLLLYLIKLRPTKGKLAEDLVLSKEDRLQFENEDRPL